MSVFQSTRPSRASTPPGLPAPALLYISIHKALAGLDPSQEIYSDCFSNFNPQGPRGPRRHPPGSPDHGGDFNPQGPRGPRRGEDTLRWMRWSISIHKALAGLEIKTIQQSLHIPLTFYALCPPPPPYFNLLHPFTQPIFTAFPLFFRCESPGHFMLAWHSHLV